jgi:Na+/H+ antiporter NhaC
MISNLEFVKESSRTFEGTDGLFWTFIIAAGMGLACYAVMLSVEDYLSNCSNKTDRKEFIRKMLVRYFLPLILIIIVAFVVCGMYGVNIFGELVIIGMIYFVITFPRFVNRYLPRE